MSDQPKRSVVTPQSGTLRETVSLAFPLVISHMSQSLMWIVDTLVLGRVGTVEQGAVGLGGVLTWTLLCFFTGTMSVVSIFVAQDYGARRNDIARHVRSGAICIVPMIPVLMGIWMLVPSILALLQVAPTVSPLAQIYIQVRLFAAPFILLSFALASYLRGVGDMVTPMLVSLLANIVNAVLAWILVLGLAGAPALGVKGAAWATAIAGVAETSMYLAVFLLSKQAVAYGSRMLQLPPRSEVFKLVTVGAPIGFATVLEMTAWTAFTAYAATRSPVELAAHTILFQVTGFCFMPAMAIGIAASILVGQYLGAQRPDVAGKSARSSVFAGVSYMTLVGAAMLLFRYPLVRAFNSDPSVVALGGSIGILAALYQPFDGLGIICQSILRGAGYTAVPTLLMFGSAIMVFVPLVYALGEVLGLGVLGAWVAADTHVVLLGFVMALVVLRGPWKNRPLLREQVESSHVATQQ